MNSLPRIGLMLGDVTGIGPEISAKLLATGMFKPLARLVIIGDARVLELGIKDALLRARLMQLALNVDAFPDARAALDGLRSIGLKVATFSNATLTMLISALKHAGLDRLIDTVVPAEPPAFKPTEAAYKFLCEKLKIDPARVLYVSADPLDADGAARAGFKVVWLRRDAAANAAPKSVVATISSLAELRPLLGR